MFKIRTFHSSAYRFTFTLSLACHVFSHSRSLERCFWNSSQSTSIPSWIICCPLQTWTFCGSAPIPDYLWASQIAPSLWNPPTLCCENRPLTPTHRFLSFHQFLIHENTHPLIPWPLSFLRSLWLRNLVKSFLEVQAYNVCWLTLSHMVLKLLRELQKD